MNSKITYNCLLLALILIASSVSLPASAKDQLVVKPFAASRFATMPENAPLPEGIAVNPNNRNVIVGTFIFNAANYLVRFSKSGRLLANVSLGDAPLLGLAYNPDDDKIYICRPTALIGAAPSLIQRIDANFFDAGSLETVVSVPMIGAPANRVEINPDGSMDDTTFGNLAQAPNAMTFADNGDLYFTDSFQGALFRVIDPAVNCANSLCNFGVDVMAHSPLLATAGFPPFGANGVALNGDASIAFVANTGDDRVLRVDLDGFGPDAGPGNSDNVDVLADSINGADGMVSDGHGHLWVAANQGDHLVALDMTSGRILATMGAFLGINRDGSPRGLSFPASIGFLQHNKLVISNLSLPLTSNESSVDAEVPEADVEKYTISVIRVPRLK